MAKKRMFSLQIVDSDAFLDMPASTQLLYFHLSMRADDEGFVGNPKRIMRAVGAGDDDYKLLIVKRFLLTFESGVVVIKHWLIHNSLRGDRVAPTSYQDERKLINVKENKAYTMGENVATISQPNDNQMSAQIRLDKIRLDKNSKARAKAPAVKKVVEKKPVTRSGETYAEGYEIDPAQVSEVIKQFETVDAKNKTYYGNKTQRQAAAFLIGEYTFDEVLKRVAFLPRTNAQPYFPSITTPVQLRDKWVTLENAVTRYKSEHQSKKPVVL